jgi:hypothetical protein
MLGRTELISSSVVGPSSVSDDLDVGEISGFYRYASGGTSPGAGAGSLATTTYYSPSLLSSDGIHYISYLRISASAALTFANRTY